MGYPDWMEPDFCGDTGDAFDVHDLAGGRVMSCPLNPADCANAIVGVVAGATGNVFADEMRSGAEWVLKTTIGWWLEVPSINIASSPAGDIRALTLPLAAAVAVAGMIWQGIVMTVSRKRDPMINIARGLMSLAVWSTVGIVGVTLALSASDEMSVAVLNAGAHGHAVDRMATLGSMQGVNSAGVVMVLGFVMILAGLAQAVLMMFREASLVILTGMVVLAAAGSFTNGTRPWLQKWLSRSLALIVYKPMVAIIFFAALRMFGESGDARVAVAGLAMLLVSIVALPVLIKFFDWVIPTGSSGGGGVLGAATGVATAGLYASQTRNHNSASTAGGSGVDPVGWANTMTATSAPGGGVRRPRPTHGFRGKMPVE